MPDIRIVVLALFAAGGWIGLILLLVLLAQAAAR